MWWSGSASARPRSPASRSSSPWTSRLPPSLPPTRPRPRARRGWRRGLPPSRPAGTLAGSSSLGEEGRAERPPLSGAAVGAAAGLTSLLGLGTALAYANLQACAAPLVPPHRSSSAIGAVRCVRDLGYAIGGVALGAVSDLSGRPWAAPALGAVAAAVAAALFEGARGRAIAAEKAAGGFGATGLRVGGAAPSRREARGRCASGSGGGDVSLRAVGESTEHTGSVRAAF